MQTIVTDKLESGDITLKQGEELTYIAFLKDGWTESRELHFNFEGADSSLVFLAIVLGTGKNKFPFKTYSNHKSPNTRAHYFVRNALFDESEIDYVGFLNIHEGAQHTDTNLAHHSLMLSAKAKTNTIPSLEIEANDVKASHAATVGRIDDDTLFYMAARGLDQRQAQGILVRGFLSADLDKISDREIQEKLNIQIEQSLT